MTLFLWFWKNNELCLKMKNNANNVNFEDIKRKQFCIYQGCHSEFGSNKVRKMVRQGKEKRLLARIFKILGKARKRLSRQNSTIKVRKCEEKRPEFTKKARKRLSRQNSTRKVRKCEEKWPEFHKKHINFRIMCSNRIDTREGSEWGTVYWDQIGRNAYILNEHHIHNTENPKAMHTLIIFHSNIILLMHWFVFPNNHNL